MIDEKMSGKLPEIKKVVVLHAPISKVWKAVSTSEGLAGWWMANTMIVEEGKEFVIRAGKYGDSECRITELDPPHKLSFNWDKDWNITFELKVIDDGKTEFTLKHSGWNADKKTRFGQLHTTIREVMDEGWTSILNDKLKEYVKV